MRIRPERVAHMIQREVADMIAHRLRDPGLGSWVSVTGVEVTGDLSFARVFVSVLSAGAEREASLQALARAAPFIRRELAHRLELREVPELRFEFDESIERGARIESLLRKLHRGEPVEDESGDETAEPGAGDAGGGPEGGAASAGRDPEGGPVRGPREKA